MPFDNIDYAEFDGIAEITLRRPEKKNALTAQMFADLRRCFDAFAAGPARVAILKSVSDDVFCAGADLSGTGKPWSAPAGAPFKTTYDSQVRLADQMTRLYELPVPVVAAVNGVAVGGGLAYALHCDVRIAAETARFGSVFIKAGFSSMDMGTSYLLPKIVGAGVARELMLTGRIIDAQEAYRIGLVHQVVPQQDLMDAALEMGRTIAANNAYGVWQTKTGLNAALDAPSLRHAKEIENRTQVLTGFTNNPREAAMAHREKRAPEWDPL